MNDELVEAVVDMESTLRLGLALVAECVVLAASEWPPIPNKETCLRRINEYRSLNQHKKGGSHE